MSISRKILLIAIFSFSAATCMARIASAQDDLKEAKPSRTEPVTDTRNANLNTDDDKQDKNPGNKNGSVKQVKSARPDMSKSRGARPPDIVRPSGSRIPKGVGRPAGAGRHGRV
jgi:hypothetical protein